MLQEGRLQTTSPNDSCTRLCYWKTASSFNGKYEPPSTISKLVIITTSIHTCSENQSFHTGFIHFWRRNAESGGKKAKSSICCTPSLPAAQLNGSYLPQRQTTPSAHRWTLASVFTIDKADRMGDKALLKCPSNSFKVQPSITFFKPVVPSGVRKTSPESEDTQATIGHSSRALCVAKHHHA